MLRRFLATVGLLTTILAGTVLTPCPTAEAAPAKRVSRVLIKKKDHVMQLLAGEDLVASYKVALGPGGPGPKRQEGDSVTPVGRYHITMHQPSQYKIFLRLDYPTPEDYRRFTMLKARGDLPANAKIGGDIGIHGPPVKLDDASKSTLKEHDWTLGCIALNEDEISEVARLVRDGTVVDIED